MENFNFKNNLEGDVVELSDKAKKFEEYESLQIDLLNEEDKAKADEIEKRLNEISDELNITQ